jgi:SulP family sulfate permease
MGALAHISDDTKVVIMQLDDVPAMDATGLVALESALTQLTRRGVRVVLSGLQPQPRDLLTRASLETRYPGVEIEPGA